MLGVEPKIMIDTDLIPILKELRDDVQSICSTVKGGRGGYVMTFNTKKFIVPYLNAPNQGYILTQEN